MKYFYASEPVHGYKEIITKNSGLDLLGFGVINLKKGENITLNSEEFEIGLVVQNGKCDINCEGKQFKDLSRTNVFAGKPVSVYIPRDSKYEVVNTGAFDLEIAVCKVKADKKYEPFAILPPEVVSMHRGKLNWQRDVNDIITDNGNGRVDKIVLGETYSSPGQWSSYPSHKHDKDNPPYEVNMEEVYYFKVNPGQGFGIQVMYNDDFTLNESYMVRNGDTIAIKEGYHPVASAPGYQVYYLWVMAGNSGRILTPNDDPKHAWVKAVEKMV